MVKGSIKSNHLVRKVQCIFFSHKSFYLFFPCLKERNIIYKSDLKSTAEITRKLLFELTTSFFIIRGSGRKKERKNKDGDDGQLTFFLHLSNYYISCIKHYLFLYFPMPSSPSSYALIHLPTLDKS